MKVSAMARLLFVMLPKSATNALLAILDDSAQELGEAIREMRREREERKHDVY